MVFRYLRNRYRLASFVELDSQRIMDPELLAWTSLCHVLLNSNEFIYID